MAMSPSRIAQPFRVTKLGNLTPAKSTSDTRVGEIQVFADLAPSSHDQLNITVNLNSVNLHLANIDSNTKGMTLCKNSWSISILQQENHQPCWPTHQMH